MLRADLLRSGALVLCSRAKLLRCRAELWMQRQLLCPPLPDYREDRWPVPSFAQRMWLLRAELWF